jgi:AcrR family transcriptional regulator
MLFHRRSFRRAVITGILSRKQRERVRHGNEMLDAAERVFARKGFHAASMADVAEEAEFAVGTLYNFFKSKEDLYRALFLRKIDQIGREMRAAVASARDPREKIEKVIELHFYFAQKFREFFQLYMTEILGAQKPVPIGSLHMQRRYQRFIKFVSGIIEQGRRTGVFAAQDPVYAGVCLIGIMHHCTTLWVSSKRPPAVEAVAAIAKNIFFNGVLKKK